MLAFAFFASVFSTLIWLIYMGMYIQDKLGGVRFSSLGLLDLTLYIALLVLPIFVLWMIFGYVNQYLNFKNLSSNMYSLFKQMKKNQDYTDLIARIMLEAEQEIKDGFILNKFDLFIADMNELLAETIQRGALAAPDTIDRLWAKVNHGGKWAFGKVIIEVNGTQSNFGNRLIDKSYKDKVLAGTILEFCARYQNLLNILEKHDKERIFLAAVETGVYGKVYSILAPLGEQIRRGRTPSAETVSLHSEKTAVINDWENEDIILNREEEPRPTLQPRRTPDADRPSEAARLSVTDRISPPNGKMAKEASVYPQIDEDERKSFIEVFNPFKRRHHQIEKDEPQVSEERDPFSIALERSFGSSAADETPTLTDRAAAEEMPVPELASSLKEPKLHINEKEFFAEHEREASMPPINLEVREEPKFTIEKEIGFTHTQKALNTLKKEWEEMKEIRISDEPPAPSLQASAEEEKRPLKIQRAEDENYAYPFGGWTDVDNYRK